MIIIMKINKNKPSTPSPPPPPPFPHPPAPFSTSINLSLKTKVDLFYLLDYDVISNYFSWNENLSFPLINTYRRQVQYVNKKARKWEILFPSHLQTIITTLKGRIWPTKCTRWYVINPIWKWGGAWYHVIMICLNIACTQVVFTIKTHGL
jgi:hypothetical protein